MFLPASVNPTKIGKNVACSRRLVFVPFVTNVTKQQNCSNIPITLCVKMKAIIDFTLQGCNFG